MTNSIREFRDSDCIFITGSNTAVSHPVISYEVVRAARRGAHVIIVDPRRIPLVDNATLFLQIKPGSDSYVFLAMMHTILREGWEASDFIAERTEGLADLVAAVAPYTPEYAALMSGVPAELIEEAARIYAHGQRASGQPVHQDERGHSAILYAMGITQRSNGTDLVKTLANLAMLCGQIGKPGTGVNPLRGQANVQGACDVGGLVNVYPGYQAVTDDAKRQAIGEKWGEPNLPSKVGLTIVEAMHAVATGQIHASYVMGENPMMSDPDTTHVESALRALDFLLVQDIFPSETAALAHLVLPAASSLEKDGTFTNTERRVQRLTPVLPAPGQAWQDWAIIAALAERFEAKMGIERPSGYWHFTGSAEIFDEMATVTPIYAGMSFDRLAGAGLQWPCPTPDHPGTAILHTAGFSRGRGKFHATLPKEPVEMPDDAYPLMLTTGRVLYHYHTGTVTRRSAPMNWAEPGGFVEVNGADATAVGLTDGDAVVVESRRGRVTARVQLSEDVPPGTVFLAFHWRESSANILTHDIELDPVAKIPEYKMTAVRLIKPQTTQTSAKIKL